MYLVNFLHPPLVSSLHVKPHTRSLTTLPPSSLFPQLLTVDDASPLCVSQCPSHHPGLSRLHAVSTGTVTLLSGGRYMFVQNHNNSPPARVN